MLFKPAITDLFGHFGEKVLNTHQLINFQVVAAGSIPKLFLTINHLQTKTCQ